MTWSFFFNFLFKRVILKIVCFLHKSTIFILIYFDTIILKYMWPSYIPKNIITSILFQDFLVDCSWFNISMNDANYFSVTMFAVVSFSLFFCFKFSLFFIISFSSTEIRDLERSWGQYVVCFPILYSFHSWCFIHLQLFCSFHQFKPIIQYIYIIFRVYILLISHENLSVLN